MNTGYDLNNPNKYMQTAFDAFKSNQPATQQAVSQGPQAGLRYLAGLQAQAQQQQAQQTQPQALPSTTVLQQLLQKLGQNHGIMAQLPASIDIASAPTQPAMATGGLVSLAAGGPIAFSGGDTVPEPDLDASYYDDDELTHEERMTRRNPEYEQWSESIEPKKTPASKTAIQHISSHHADISEAQEKQALEAAQREYYKGQAGKPLTPSGSMESMEVNRAKAAQRSVAGGSSEPSAWQRRPEPIMQQRQLDLEETLRKNYANDALARGRNRVGDLAQKSNARLDELIAQQEALFNQQQEQKSAQRAAARAARQPAIEAKAEKLLAEQRARLTPRAHEFGPFRPTDSWNEPPKTSGTGEGIFSRAGKAIAEHPITKGIGKIGRHLGAAGFVLDPQMWDATKAPMIIAKAATGTPLSKGEVESLTPGKSIADPIYRAANLTGTGSYTERGLEYLYDNAGRYLNWHDTDRPETATPFVGPTKPAESPVHEPVAKAEPSAAAKQGVNAVSPTEHAKRIEKQAEAPKGKEPQGAVPEEKQYEFDQHRDEYRDDHQPQGQTVSQPTDREYTPAPETSGIASVTPEDMLQHLQRLGGGGYQEDPEVAQMRSEQLESAKANKWANSIAGLIGGIYGGHSPYASENVARGIMTALGQYQAGTQAEDAIRSGIMGSKEAAQKSQAASQQHWMDKFIEAQLAKGRDQASIMRERMSGDARLGAAEIQAKARQGAAQQRMVENALKNKQYKDAADQRLAVETAKAALRAVDEYVKNYVGIPSEADKKRVFLTVWHKLSPHIPITDEEVAGMTGSPPPTGSPGNPTATYGSSSNQISDEDED